MTVKLLSAWGNQLPGTLYTSDANTEAAMITAKVATATLAGAGPWTPPAASPNIGQSYPIILAQSAIPMILPSSGTMGANGSLTGLTALPYSVFPQPCFMYFPAGKVFSGSPAGMYYASILTTTTAQVYNNMYTSGRPQDAIPVVPTPVVDAGPGAYTQTTAADLTLASITVPGGMMGPNGLLRWNMQASCANSAGAKTIQIKFAGTALVTSIPTTNGGIAVRNSIRNRGNLINQVGSHPGQGSQGLGLLTAGLQYLAINTAVDQTLAITGNLATATDFVAMEGIAFEVLPG